MTTTTLPSADSWRTLSEAEASALPESRLGGPLAVIVYAAAALVAGVIVLIAVFIALGNVMTLAMMMNSIMAGTSLTSYLARINLVPQIVIVVWAGVVTAMAFARNPSTPRVASVLIVVWVVAAIAAQILGRIAIAQQSFDLGSQASLIPYIIFEIAMAAAFWGYMHDSRRPNIYFRRRVRV